jgi:hypothetical protein
MGDAFRAKIKDISRWDFAAVQGLPRKLPLSVRFLVQCVDVTLEDSRKSY